MKDRRTVRRTMHSRISFVHRSMRCSQSMRAESATRVESEAYAEEVERPAEGQVQGLSFGPRPDASTYTRREP